MSIKNWPGGRISPTPPTPTGPYQDGSASGVWTLDQVAYWIQQGLWPIAGNLAPDPYFEYVTMLLPGNGTNGAQNNTFLDSSTNNFTITRNGNTTQGTFTPYGPNWSNYFNGSSDYLTLSTNTALVPSADFTLECWINPALLTAAPNGRCIAMSSSWGSGGWMLRHSATAGKIDFFVYDFSNGAPLIQSSTVMSAGVWYHIAVTRSGNSWRMFVNGTQEGGTQTYSGTPSLALTNIGRFWDGVDYFGGYISNLRLVKGTAVYTANFTPSTSPLTAITNTSLLTCQSNRFIDNSPNNFTITRNGDVSVQRFSPFNPSASYSAATIGGSGYFDGSGDTLTTTGGGVSGTGAFTVEFWVYPSLNSTQQLIYGDTTVGSLYVYFYSDNLLYISNFGITNQFASIAVSRNAWTHVVIARNSSGTYSVFLNGSRVATLSSNTTNYTAMSTVRVGGEASANFLLGYLSGLRVSTTTALYDPTQTSISVPTAPVTGGSLLLNFTNGGIIDNAMMNDLETVGNAQISTSVSKFGGGSLAFDGTGDYLVAASTPQTIFSGSFTIEFWINFTSIPANFIALVGGTTANTQLFITTKSNGQGIRFGLTGVAEYAAGTFTWATGNWYHIALVRNGTDVRFYVNGTNVSDSTYTNSTTYSGVLLIGGGVSGAVDFPGYIDDLRITKGYARYTANFTPPTAPFPLQ